MPPKKQENNHIIHSEPIVEEKQKKEKPEITDAEFIDALVEMKQKYCNKIEKQKQDQECIIECLNSPTKFNHACQQNKEILLNERRKLVSKFMAKIPQQKVNETEKEQITRFTKMQELKKNVMKYDNHYQIQQMHLNADDYRY